MSAALLAGRCRSRQAALTLRRQQASQLLLELILDGPCLRRQGLPLRADLRLEGPCLRRQGLPS